MKGLSKYLKKHGYHFTERLVREILPIVWDFPEIANTIKDKVWYNCWSATSGDMLFLVNLFHSKAHYSKRECIRMMLVCVGTYSCKDVAFKDWLDNCSIEDISVYI